MILLREHLNKHSCKHNFFKKKSRNLNNSWLLLYLVSLLERNNFRLSIFLCSGLF